MSGYIKCCHKDNERDKDCCCKIINNINVNTNTDANNNCGNNDSTGNGLLREFDGSVTPGANIGFIGTSFVTAGTVSLTIEGGDRVLLNATIPWVPTNTGIELVVEIERDGSPIYTINDVSGNISNNITTSLNFLDTTAPAGLVTYTLRIMVTAVTAVIQSFSSVIFTASRIAPNA